MFQVITNQGIETHLLFWEGEALPCHPVEKTVETFCVALSCARLYCEAFKRT